MRAPGPRAQRRGLAALVVVLALGFALFGLVSAMGGSALATVDDEAREVARTLRCPVCVGEDVADSAAPLAESMRLVIAEQLAEGRSGDEIRAWFAQRYGDEVLLDPPRRGAGWALWAIPLGVMGLGTTVLAHRWRPGWLPVGLGVASTGAVLVLWLVPGSADGDRAAQAAPGSGPPAAVDPAAIEAETAPLTVLADAVAELPGNAPLRATLASRLEAEGQFGPAAQEYAALVRLQPLDPDLRYREAFALLRSGDEPGARAALEESLLLEPDHPASLLLLGSVLQEQDPAEGARLLDRFLEVAPEHAQAEEVRRWLERHDQGDG